MRILVDTNVILDLLLKKEPYFNDGVTFINNCRAKRHSIYLNAMSFRDIEYILRKKLNSKAELSRYLNAVYCLITKIIPLTADDAINAIFDPGKDFEDTLLSNSAQSAMLDCIVTSNEKHFEGAKIPVFSLSKFNEII